MKHYLHSLAILSGLAMTLPALAAEPVAPSGVNAESTEAGVVVTWQPVTEDVDENPVNPDEVIYDVYRCDLDDVKTKVAEDIVETTCTDVLGEITGEVFYRWQVIAKTADGSSSAWEGYSQQLGFGDGAALPYIETFNTLSGWSMAPDNYWLSENAEGWSGFDVDSELYFDDNGTDCYIYGEDRTDTAADGFLYFEPSKWSDTDTSFTSGSINLTDAENPVMSYSYYTIPECHVAYQIRIVDDNGNADQVVNSTPSSDSLGWKKSGDISLEAYKGQKIRIQIHSAYYPDNAPSTGRLAPVCLDNFKVEEGGGNVGVASVETADEAETAYYTVDGRRVVNPSAGQLIIKVIHGSDGSVSVQKVIIR